jgi:hypothetical protein
LRWLTEDPHQRSARNKLPELTIAKESKLRMFCAVGLDEINLGDLWQFWHSWHLIEPRRRYGRIEARLRDRIVLEGK